jgi:hypothetical protein
MTRSLSARQIARPIVASVSIERGRRATSISNICVVALERFRRFGLTDREPPFVAARMERVDSGAARKLVSHLH